MCVLMTTYQIANWHETFETADSRRHKSLTWVSLPNDLQSNGYQTLIEQQPDHAAELYGAWCALIAVASKCPTRGVLAASNGSAYTVQRLATLTYLPVETMQRLIDWATTQSVGWLEVCDSPDCQTTDTRDQTTVNQPTNSDDCKPVELPYLTQPNPTNTHTHTKRKSNFLIPKSYEAATHQIEGWHDHLVLKLGRPNVSSVLESQLKGASSKGWDAVKLIQSIEFSLTKDAKSLIDPNDDFARQRGSPRPDTDDASADATIEAALAGMNS